MKWLGLFAALACVGALAGCTVTRDEGLYQAWQSFANNNTNQTDWSGGDGGATVPLGDRGVAWIFADTWRDRIDNTTNPPSHTTPLFQARNSIVVTRSGVPPETLGPPSDLITGGQYRFNTGDGTVETDAQGNKVLRVIAFQIKEPPGYNRIAIYVATFSLPDLTLQGVQRASPPDDQVQNTPGDPAVFWGLTLLERPEATYVYGNAGQATYVARAPAGNLLGPWEYRTASGWTTNEHAAANLGPVGDLSVIQYGDKYYGFGTGGNPANPLFNDEIMGCAADQPWGPFDHCASIYQIPEVNDPSTPGNPDSRQIIAYSVRAHPEDVTGDGMLMTYSLNCSCAVQDAAMYRPRYLRILP